MLALPLLVPWASTTEALEFATRLGPAQVVPIHDFYTTKEGRRWLAAMAGKVLGEAGIDFVSLDWGDSYTV